MAPAKPPKPAPTALAEAIENEMLNRGDSQRATAEAIGCTQQAISRWIDGQLVPDAKWLPAISRYVHKPVSEVRAMHAAARRTKPQDRESVVRLERIETQIKNLAREVRRLADGLDS